MNTWTSLGLSVDIPTTPEASSNPSSPAKGTINRRPTFSFQKESEQTELCTVVATDFSAKILKWNLSLVSSEDGSELFARLSLLSPSNSTLTYKVTVKIGRSGQLPLCPTMSLPREITSQSSPQTWKILPMELLCSPTNGLITEDSLELFIDLVCYGSRAEGEKGQVQLHPTQWNRNDIDTLESGLKQ